MKRMNSLLLAVVILIEMIICLPVKSNAVSVEAVGCPKTDAGELMPWEVGEYQDYSGRLYIPSAGISVALYNDMSQYVCDRRDSACFFDVPGYDGMVIADHSNQEFESLTAVSAGDTGRIVTPNGAVIHIRCAEVINGHNTGDFITDGNYNVILGRYAYLTYTCMDGWQNVRVCQWEITGYGTVTQLNYSASAEMNSLIGSAA